MTTATTRTNQIKDALWGAGIYDVTVSTLKSGNTRIRRSYYYRPAEGLDRWAGRVLVALTPLGYALSRTSDDWAAYPKTSYFTVELRSAN